MHKKRILLKLTGNVLVNGKNGNPSTTTLKGIVDQILQLRDTHLFGIVIGGGNFFRGNQHGKEMGLNPSTGHQIGMLATVMNGLIIKDLCDKKGMTNTLFCALPCPQIAQIISQDAINHALANEHCMIFSGGTGNPFFTTDTNAILRGLQMQADEVWKGTNIDGIYTEDPQKNTDAQKLSTITYEYALQHNLGIMDTTAYALGQTYKQRIRIFNIFEKDALLKAAKNTKFGSIIE